MLLNRSRGELGGKPFAQHYSCPAFLDAQIGLTMWRLWGYIFVWEKYCLNRAAQRGLHSIGTAPLLRRWSRSHTAQGGALSPCGAERKSESRTCATSSAVVFIEKYDNAPSARASRLPLKNGCCHFSYRFSRLPLPVASFAHPCAHYAPCHRDDSSRKKVSSSKSPLRHA